VKLSQKT
jgi:hypothetical protein